MGRKRLMGRGALSVLCAAFFGLVGARAQADSWIRAESDHFTVYSNTSESTLRPYVKKLEAFRALTNLLLGAADTGPQVRFDIYLLKNQDQITQIRPSFSRYVAGVYFHCAEGSLAYAAKSDSSGAVFDQDDQSLQVLLHEYSHYIMSQHAKTYYPTWYVEGFAEYLSTADLNNGKISIGDASKSRGYVLAEDRWIDFAKVLKPDFSSTGDKHNDAWEIASFYAQSWLLTHYMLSDTTRTKALNAYFADVSKGADPVTSFEAETGLKVKSLQRTLENYQRNMFFMAVPIAAYPDAAVRISRLPDQADQFVVKASLLQTCVSQTQGEDLLAKLTAQKGAFGADADHRLAVARAQILFGDAAAAQADLTALTAAEPSNFEANYLLGRAALRLADGQSGEARSLLMDQARDSFIAAYRLNKLNAPNLYFLGRSFGNQPGFPDKNALNAALGAHTLAPGVPDYAFFAAFTALANNQRDQAIALLIPLTSDPHNRQMAERCSLAIEAIKAGKPLPVIMRVLNGAAPAAGKPG